MRWSLVVVISGLIIVGLGLWLQPGLLNIGATNQVIDINKRHPNDKRQMRALTLANKLTVLLISDPNVNKSAAAMDVGVGSLEDPQEHLGLAHFLEHMLFLGTSKYPDVEEYNRYLHSYQGHSNAYTAGENTNYHFEVNHDGFEGSLDRFAQFFIAPLFNPEYVERERQAVNSEHQKNLNDDFWRSRMLQRSLHKPGHPRQKFSTGDLQTLKATNRETLVAFYKKYYSANQMKLAVLSSASLDQLEGWVREKFAAVPNFDRPKLEYDPQLFDQASLPRLVEIKPVKNLKRLELLFATPSSDLYWRSKPASTIAHLVGHEGQGSLLSFLKKANLATGLAAWNDSSLYGGTFHFDITLTDLGVDRRNEVIGHFFAYINMLRKKGYERYIYDERKTMADINFVYRDLKEGTDVVAGYAARMHQFEPLAIDRNESLMHEYSRADFDLFLNQIKPENLSAFFSAPSVNGDQKEPYYGTSYKISRFEPSAVKRWTDMPADGQMTLPPPNEFIPKRLTILTSEQATKPQRLIDNEWGLVWYQLDDTYKLPKAHVQLLLLTPRTNSSPREKALSLLYGMALGESLNEWNYDIGIAGLHFSLARVERGFQLDFSGYAENLPSLMRTVVSKLTKLTIDAERFDVLKTELKRSIANTRLEVAYQQVLYELRYLSSRSAIHKDEIFEPIPGGRDLISSITLADVQKYADEAYQQIALEGAAYGSLDADETRAAIMEYTKALAKSPLPAAARPPVDNLELPLGKPLAKVMSSEDNNNCWARMIQFGRRDARRNAIMRVAHAHLKTTFFGQLRTEQQLGYIVHSGLNHQERGLGMLFLIQSSEYSPYEVGRRVAAWQKRALDELAKLDDKTLAAYKLAVATELREKDKTMADRHQTLVFEAVTMEGQFDYKETIAKQVETLTRDEIVAVFSKAFDAAASASLTVYLSKPESTPETPTESLIQNAREFKAASSVL